MKCDKIDDGISDRCDCETISPDISAFFYKIFTEVGEVKSEHFDHLIEIISSNKLYNFYVEYESEIVALIEVIEQKEYRAFLDKIVLLLTEIACDIQCIELYIRNGIHEKIKSLFQTGETFRKLCNENSNVALFMMDFLIKAYSFHKRPSFDFINFVYIFIRECIKSENVLFYIKSYILLKNVMQFSQAFLRFLVDEGVTNFVYERILVRGDDMIDALQVFGYLYPNSILIKELKAYNDNWLSVFFDLMEQTQDENEDIKDNIISSILVVTSKCVDSNFNTEVFLKLLETTKETYNMKVSTRIKVIHILSNIIESKSEYITELLYDENFIAYLEPFLETEDTVLIDSIVNLIQNCLKYNFIQIRVKNHAYIDRIIDFLRIYLNKSLPNEISDRITFLLNELDCLND